MTKSLVRRTLCRIFLTLAYLMIALQWLWVLTISVPLLIETGVFNTFIQSPQVSPATSPQLPEFSPILAALAGVITLVFLVLTIIVFIKLPKAITNTGEKIVHQSSAVLIPVITQHKKIPVKKRRQISRRVTRAIQLLLIVIPFIASFFIPPVQTITSQIITTLAICLAGIGALCLVISWLLEPIATSQTRSRVSRE